MDKDKNNTPDQAEEDAAEYAVDLITLTDEEGVEHTFELVDTLERDGKSYVALIAAIEEGANDYLEGDGDLIIMRVAAEEDGEEILELIADDDEFETVSDIFMDRLSDLYEFEEDDASEEPKKD